MSQVLCFLVLNVPEHSCPFSFKEDEQCGKSFCVG
jgi:hypothetical protein